MPSSDATDAQLLHLIRASLAIWRIGARVNAAADGGWLVSTSEGQAVRIGRAPPHIPFRWLVVTAEGRERPASSVAGLLRVLRSTLDREWRPGRARIAALRLPPAS